MPQKRNPDVLELVRAGAARMQQRHAEVVAIYSRLTSGYHRDLQLTKQPFVEGLREAGDVFAVMLVALQSLRVVPERCRAAMVRSIGATDEVYRRVATGMPFRQAYREVGANPEGAVAAEEVAELWRGRTHQGAPGNLGLERASEDLARMRTWCRETAARLASVWNLLDQHSNAVSADE